MSSSEYTELSQLATEEPEGDKDSASSAGGGAAEEKPLLEQEAEDSDAPQTPAGADERIVAQKEAEIEALKAALQEALTPRRLGGAGLDLRRR
eukprot:COSAG04_NODE_55_length_30619_cov_12.038991_7_plen_93_part_00